MTVSNIPKVVVEEDAVTVPSVDSAAPTRFNLKRLPGKYVDWINQGRSRMYKSILVEKQTNIRFFSQHLPVVVTSSKNNPFPFNCGNKGVGFVPKEAYLPEFIELLEDTHHRTRNRPWRESLKERVRAMSKFYFDGDKVDYRAVSSLEIFEKTTFTNLCETPLASLLYTGDCPDYTSFQLDCAVEIVGPDDPRHRFAVLSRTMFEFDNFHITQSKFPWAYLFWITDVKDKTPFRVADQPESEKRVEMVGKVPWQDDAVQALNRAPGMVQEFIRESVEGYAMRRGFKEITLDVLQEARENLM